MTNFRRRVPCCLAGRTVAGWLVHGLSEESKLKLAVWPLILYSHHHVVSITTQCSRDSRIRVESPHSALILLDPWRPSRVPASVASFCN